MTTCSPVVEIAVHLAVAGGVCDGVYVLTFFPRDVLVEILDLIESVSEGFPAYALKYICSGTKEIKQ